MKRTIALLLAAVMTLAILASCGTNEKQAYLNAMLEGTGFSGVVLVTKNGRTLCETARGTVNNDSKEPITTDTQFCIGSVSKQFAAAAILLLRQDGKLSVDDSLSKYFPNYRYGRELTIRHLLEMRSPLSALYLVTFPL
ncbi:MAG: serine hydrolase domain-containing protein [Ruminococcus sp.]